MWQTFVPDLLPSSTTPSAARPRSSVRAMGWVGWGWGWGREWSSCGVIFVARAGVNTRCDPIPLFCVVCSSTHRSFVFLFFHLFLRSVVGTACMLWRCVAARSLARRVLRPDPGERHRNVGVSGTKRPAAQRVGATTGSPVPPCVRFRPGTRPRHVPLAFQQQRGGVRA